MQADVILKLGDFTFSSLEIPSKINFGGEQSLVVHELVGGVRVVDSMGRSDAPLEWSGMFQGAGALQRARYVDYLRTAGQQINLTYGEFNYLVVIKSYHATFERFYQIPYSISCVVVADLSLPQTQLIAAGIDDQMRDDMAACNGLVNSIGDSTTSGLFASFKTAAAAISSFATASKSAINGVLSPLATLRGQVQSLQAAKDSITASKSTIGKVTGLLGVASASSDLLSAVGSAGSFTQLFNLDKTLGRMQKNISIPYVGGKTQTVGGGNLYAIAQQNYGDANQWTNIAAANNLKDPKLTGINTLNIPKTKDSSAGILLS